MRDSIAILRTIAQPPECSPSVTDRAYRLVSIYLSYPLARAGTSPNAITVGWIVIGLVGVAGLLADAWAARVAAALLLELSYLLDFVDGEVARLTDRRSAVGGLLDLLGHGALKAALPLAVGAAAAWQTGLVLFAVAGGVASVAIAVGDTLRFYAACTLRSVAPDTLGHTVVTRPPGRERRITLGVLVAVTFELSFESPGLYGLALLGALADRLDILTAYWALGGAIWFGRRAAAACRQLAGERTT